MSEEMDLNKLVRKARDERASEKPQETREQQIDGLKVQINALEETVKGPNAKEAFLAKSPEEQRSALDALHRDHPETKESVSDVQRYIEFIYNSGPDLDSLRLVAAKKKLDKLQSS